MVYFFEMVLGVLSSTFLRNKLVGEGVNRGGKRLNRVGYDGKGSLIKNYKKTWSLPSISTFNPNNPPVYSANKNFVEFLKDNNVPRLESIKLIKSKQQTPNLRTCQLKGNFTTKK